MLAQLSYLTATRNSVAISLAVEDAQNLFEDLGPIGGVPFSDPAMEITRRAELFQSLTAEIELDYPASVVSNVGEAGFSEEIKEGSRVRRTHLMIERNRIIRRRFFAQNPSTQCDLCEKDVKIAYPWVHSLLEVHHLLPLCSGARTSRDGTLLVDLVANCPSCHRAVHRYYDKWLHERARLDFENASEAKEAYNEAQVSTQISGRFL